MLIRPPSGHSSMEHLIGHLVRVTLSPPCNHYGNQATLRTYQSVLIELNLYYICTCWIYCGFEENAKAEIDFKGLSVLSTNAKRTYKHTYSYTHAHTYTNLTGRAQTTVRKQMRRSHFWMRACWLSTQVWRGNSDGSPSSPRGQTQENGWQQTVSTCYYSVSSLS